jgi:hypothetical protein
MSKQNAFITGCLLALAALSLGIVLALHWGGELPGWLLSLELVLILGAALVCGFTGAWPRLGPWLRCRPIQGAALVCLGVAVIFVPVTFLVAAVVIGIGTRLVWLSACELDGKGSTELDVRAVDRDTALAGSRGVSVPHPAACEPVHQAGELEHYPGGWS